MSSCTSLCPCHEHACALLLVETDAICSRPDVFRVPCDAIEAFCNALLISNAPPCNIEKMVQSKSLVPLLELCGYSYAYSFVLEFGHCHKLELIATVLQWVCAFSQRWLRLNASPCHSQSCRICQEGIVSCSTRKVICGLFATCIEMHWRGYSDAGDVMASIVLPFGMTGALAARELYHAATADPKNSAVLFDRIVDNLTELAGAPTSCRHITRVTSIDIRRAMLVTVGPGCCELHPDSYCRLHVDPLSIAKVLSDGGHEHLVSRHVRNHRLDFEAIVDNGVAIDLAVVENRSRSTISDMYAFCSISSSDTTARQHCRYPPPGMTVYVRIAMQIDDKFPERDRDNVPFDRLLCLVADACRFGSYRKKIDKVLSSSDWTLARLSLHYDDGYLC